MAQNGAKYRSNKETTRIIEYFVFDHIYYSLTVIHTDIYIITILLLGEDSVIYEK